MSEDGDEEVPDAPSVTYEIGELYRILDELEGMFAELKYIDDALDYLSEKEAEWWQGHGIFDPSAIHVEREFGTTAPFTRGYRIPDKWFVWQDSPTEAIDAHLAELSRKAQTTAADDIASIRERIKPFIVTMDGYTENVIAPLENVHRMFTDELYDDFGKLQQTLGDWEGRAAESFADNFYNPFSGTLRSQMSILSALTGAATAAKAITEATQHSIMTVVCSIRDQAREQLQLRQHRADVANEESKRNALIIAGAGSTIVAAVITGGLWSAALGTVAGASSIASTAVPSDASKKYLLAGNSFEELRDALSDALRVIDDHDDRQHEELQDRVEDVLERVEDLRNGTIDEDGRLIPISPELVDGVDGSDFYLP